MEAESGNEVIQTMNLTVLTVDGLERPRQAGDDVGAVQMVVTSMLMLSDHAQIIHQHTCNGTAEHQPTVNTDMMSTSLSDIPVISTCRLN